MGGVITTYLEQTKTERELDVMNDEVIINKSTAKQPTFQ